jgi:glycosyltransferase involved in cell wall biosynthesis
MLVPLSIAMASRPLVLLLIPHLGGGGAERVMALLARGLSPEKYDVHLGLITQQDAGEHGPPLHVTVHCIGARRVRNGALPLCLLVRRLKPDLILSSMFHLNYLVILLRPLFPRKTRVLLRHNGAMSSRAERGSLTGRRRRLLCRMLYPHADGIICQTKTMRRDFADVLGRDNNLHVVPNPVDVATIRGVMDDARKQWTGPGPHLLAVGRLCREKGFDLLLTAFADVRAKYPQAELTIAGWGIEEAGLRAQCRALGMDTSVQFTGHIAQTASWFPGASLFVLSSREEALPNALLEAAAGGLPMVALPACGGIADLLAGLQGVWLAPEISAKALASSLLTALENLRPGERFAHEWVSEFRLDCAIERWQELIDRTLIGMHP